MFTPSIRISLICAYSTYTTPIGLTSASVSKHAVFIVQTFPTFMIPATPHRRTMPQLRTHAFPAVARIKIAMRLRRIDTLAVFISICRGQIFSAVSRFSRLFLFFPYAESVFTYPAFAIRP